MYAVRTWLLPTHHGLVTPIRFMDLSFTGLCNVWCLGYTTLLSKFLLTNHQLTNFTTTWIQILKFHTQEYTALDKCQGVNSVTYCCLVCVCDGTRNRESGGIDAWGLGAGKRKATMYHPAVNKCRDAYHLCTYLYSSIQYMTHSHSAIYTRGWNQFITNSQCWAISNDHYKIWHVFVHWYFHLPSCWVDAWFQDDQCVRYRHT